MFVITYECFCLMSVLYLPSVSAWRKKINVIVLFCITKDVCVIVTGIVSVVFEEKVFQCRQCTFADLLMLRMVCAQFDGNLHSCSGEGDKNA